MQAYSYSYGLQKMRLRLLVFCYSTFWLFFCQGMVFYFSKRLLLFYIWASIGSKGKRKKERKEQSTEILNIHFKLEISVIRTNWIGKELETIQIQFLNVLYVRSCCKLGAAQLIINCLPLPLLSTSITHSSNIYSKTFFIRGGRLNEPEGPNS